MGIETKQRLLIGGPGAGAYREMPKELEIWREPVHQRVAVSGMDSAPEAVRFDHATYLCERLRAPGIEIVVYRWDGMTVAEMLQELVLAYARPQPRRV